jgi:hypothetical protein
MPDARCPMPVCRTGKIVLTGTASTVAAMDSPGEPSKNHPNHLDPDSSTHRKRHHRVRSVMNFCSIGGPQHNRPRSFRNELMVRMTLQGARFIRHSLRNERGKSATRRGRTRIDHYGTNAVCQVVGVWTETRLVVQAAPGFSGRSKFVIGSGDDLMYVSDTCYETRRQA